MSLSSVRESVQWHGTAAAAVEQGCQMSCVRCRALQRGGEDGDPVLPRKLFLLTSKFHFQFISNDYFNLSKIALVCIYTCNSAYESAASSSERNCSSLMPFSAQPDVRFCQHHSSCFLQHHPSHSSIIHSIIDVFEELHQLACHTINCLVSVNRPWCGWCTATLTL